jgi:hypothetical protein
VRLLTHVVVVADRRLLGRLGDVMQQAAGLIDAKSLINIRPLHLALVVFTDMTPAP